MVSTVQDDCSKIRGMICEFFLYCFAHNIDVSTEQLRFVSQVICQIGLIFLWDSNLCILLSASGTCMQAVLFLALDLDVISSIRQKSTESRFRRIQRKYVMGNVGRQNNVNMTTNNVGPCVRGVDSVGRRWRVMCHGPKLQIMRCYKHFTASCLKYIMKMLTSQSRWFLSCQLYSTVIVLL